MKVVTLRALGLGDLLTAVPALRAIRRAFPDADHLLAAPAALEPLALASGAVDEVVPVGGLLPLPSACQRPDVAVNLHGNGPESHRLLLATDPRGLVAFRHPAIAAVAGGPRWDDTEHEVVRWCRLLAHHGIDADPTDLDLRPPAGPVPAVAVGATVIHPGAKSAARRWPVDRFAAVAANESAAGRPVVVTGGPGEEALARQVADTAGLDATSVLAGRTDLATLARVVAAGARVVCGDTGVAHLATAVGTPSVVVFGPTPPAQWGPPPERSRHRALWAGRVGDPLADEVFDGLLDVGADDVVDALAALPGSTMEHA